MIGEEAYSAAYNKGKALSLEQAISLATQTDKA